jgi:hypothetical protein
MEFSSTFSQAWSLIERQVRKSSAEASSCPDNPKELWVSEEYLQTAEDALALLLVLPLVCPSTQNYFLIKNIREHLAKMVENYRWQGGWSVVGRVLQTTDSLSCYQSWTIILERYSPQDFFGNVVPRMVQALRSIKWRKVYFSVVSDTRRVTRVQRRRGYNDKGSWRPSHHWLPDRFPAREEVPKVHVKEPRSFAWFKVFGEKGSG